MSNKVNQGSGIIKLIAIIAVVGLLMSAFGKNAKNIFTDREHQTELILSVTYHKWENHKAPQMHVTVILNEKDVFYDEDIHSPWARNIRVDPGTKVELKAYVIGAGLMYADCMIADTDGNIHANNPLRDNKDTVICLASIL